MTDWHRLPDLLLSHIFSYFTARNLVAVGLVCHQWRNIALSRHLWERLLDRDFRVSTRLDERQSHYDEYKRLSSLATVKSVAILRTHNDEVDLPATLSFVCLSTCLSSLVIIFLLVFFFLLINYIVYEGVACCFLS